jgi:DNA-directed RNA polymerase specialized sigma24 family protein
MKSATRKPERWTLTAEAFEAMLRTLDPDRPAAAARYEALRQRLIKFFQWERCSFPEDRADEVLNRFARRVAGGEAVERPESYCYGIARLVVREAQVEMERQAELSRKILSAPRNEPGGPREIDRCLQKCLESLPADQYALLIAYYDGEKTGRIRNRLRLSAEYGVSMNTLRNRALRLREKVENCTRRCLDRRIPRDITARDHTDE